MINFPATSPGGIRTRAFGARTWSLTAAAAGAFRSDDLNMLANQFRTPPLLCREDSSCRIERCARPLHDPVVNAVQSAQGWECYGAMIAVMVVRYATCS